jgi:hypothetical protein
LTDGHTVTTGAKSLKSKSKLMSNGKLRSDTTGSKDVVKLDLPQDKKESVFGCAECLLEDATWCLKNFRYLIVLSNGEMRATFEVSVVDNQIKKFRCVG